jgi:hypothetical protein
MRAYYVEVCYVYKYVHIRDINLRTKITHKCYV